MTNLDKFIETERDRFSTKDNNLFANSFSQISRYLQFVNVITERYNEASERYFGNFTSRVGGPPGTWPATDERRKLLDEAHVLTIDLHLEIESFFLFAKILLDKIAHSLEFYFGQVRRIALDSHDDLVKQFASYAQAKKLVSPPGWIELAASLKRNISDCRDYRIAHDKSPRRISGTAHSAGKSARIISTTLYPSAKDQQAVSQDLHRLKDEIDAYIEKLVELITTNRTSTRLK